MRSKGHIDRSVEQRERRPAVRAQRIPKHMARAIVISGADTGIIGCTDDNGAVETGAFRSSGQIQRMQPIHINRAGLLCFDDDVNRQGDWINYRRAGDPDFRRDIGRAQIPVGHGGDSRARVDETGLPKRRGVGAGIVIGIEGIEGVMFRGHVNDVVRAFARDVHIGHDQRLRIYKAIQSARKQSSKTVRVYVGQR